MTIQYWKSTGFISVSVKSWTAWKRDGVDWKEWKIIPHRSRCILFVRNQRYFHHRLWNRWTILEKHRIHQRRSEVADRLEAPWMVSAGKSEKKIRIGLDAFSLSGINRISITDFETDAQYWKKHRIYQRRSEVSDRLEAPRMVSAGKRAKGFRICLDAFRLYGINSISIGDYETDAQYWKTQDSAA